MISFRSILLKQIKLKNVHIFHVTIQEAEGGIKYSTVKDLWCEVNAWFFYMCTQLCAVSMALSKAEHCERQICAHYTFPGPNMLKLLGSAEHITGRRKTAFIPKITHTNIVCACLYLCVCVSVTIIDENNHHLQSICTPTEWVQSALCVYCMYVSLQVGFLCSSDINSSFRASTAAHWGL